MHRGTDLPSSGRRSEIPGWLRRQRDWTDSPALDVLPGCYDDWVLAEREQIRQRTLHALEALSRLLAALGRFGEAVEAAMTAVQAEPLRESAQRTLIDAHLGEGNVVEARRSFLVYRQLLNRELGVEPSRYLSEAVRLNRESTRAEGRL